MMLVEQTTVPTAALPVAEFKDHLRLGTGFADDGVQDDVLETYLRAAIATIVWPPASADVGGGGAGPPGGPGGVRHPDSTRAITKAANVDRVGLFIAHVQPSDSSKSINFPHLIGPSPRGTSHNRPIQGDSAATFRETARATDCD